MYQRENDPQITCSYAYGREVKTQGKMKQMGISSPLQKAELRISYLNAVPSKKQKCSVSDFVLRQERKCQEKTKCMSGVLLTMWTDCAADLICGTQRERNSVL